MGLGGYLEHVTDGTPMLPQLFLDSEGGCIALYYQCILDLPAHLFLACSDYRVFIFRLKQIYIF